MKHSLILALLAAFLLATCGRYGPGSLRRDQEQYEVVEEGAASGGSATLAAPGEAPPVLPTLTGTNADTTTAFTIPTGTMTDTAVPPGSIAGTFPTGDWNPPPRPRPRTPPPPPPPPTTTVSEPEPPPTTTEPPPQPRDEEEEQEEKEEEDETPPKTDTQPPPAEAPPSR